MGCNCKVKEIKKKGLKYLLQRIFFLVIAISFMSSASHAQDSLMITISPEEPHRFAFTNKVDAFWYGNTQAPNSFAFMGYTIAEQRYLLDYTILGNQNTVDRRAATQIRLYPDRLEREFKQFTETFWFVDSLPMLVIQLEGQSRASMAIQLKWDAAISRSIHWYPKDTYLQGYVPELQLRKKRAWIGITTSHKSFSINTEDLKNAEEGITTIPLPHQLPNALVVYFGFDSLEVAHVMGQVQQQLERFLAVRKQRIRQLLKTNNIVTANSLVNKAVAWARISLDDLITHQGMPGIWAGLPWFNNYWGRDTFIAFRGALLTSGQFSLAKNILLAFAKQQNTNPLARELGRIPNRITLNEIVYNTADGTGWFVQAVAHYIHYSGDSLFVGEIFPVIKKAIDGALEKRVDEYGLLTHGDAETWMDAALGDQAWSPRGNRAVEVQVLWLEMLRLGIQWARQLGYHSWAEKWSVTYRRALTHFMTMFWDAERQRLVDHLKPDGTADAKIRPNAVFAITIPEKSLLRVAQQQAVLKELVTHLVFPWGVASLDQQDPDFHPYHHYPPYYVPDAAYHNGIVWTWLSGPVLEALYPWHPKLADSLFKAMAQQILTLDGIGSHSELLEAWPRPGQSYPQVSGTVSQAWNLAEFLRILQERIAGIQPYLEKNELIIAPAKGSGWWPLRFQVPLGKAQIKGEVRYQAGKWQIELNAKHWPVQRLKWRFPFDNGEVIGEMLLNEHQNVNIVAQLNDGNPMVQVNTIPVAATWLPHPQNEHWQMAQPTMDFSIPALQKPAYTLLKGDVIARRPGFFNPIVFDIKDATGDDKGPNGRYVYPKNPYFLPGILDIERVKIRKDKQYYYFEIWMKNLVNPGWHPEAGFQLTYLAIALNFGDKGGIRRTRVGHHANFKLPLEYAYNRIIYVGNGIEVRDGHDKILAAYIPAQEKIPIGNINDRSIRFAIPIEMLSEHTLRTVAVLCGAQDDHGGGGIGDFRTVGKEAGEWIGGGGEKNTGNPNVYDWLYLQR